MQGLASQLTVSVQMSRLLERYSIARSAEILAVKTYTLLNLNKSVALKGLRTLIKKLKLGKVTAEVGDG